MTSTTLLQTDQLCFGYPDQVSYTDPRTEAFDQLTIPDYFAAARERYPHFDDAALPALLEGLALTPHMEKRLFMLSTGSKRKVYLAAAFASGAPVNLLDDPFSGLDKASIDFVCRTLERLSEEGERAWVAAFYEIPPMLTSTQIIDLGD